MITNAQIYQLWREAAEAGDMVQVHICTVALGDENPVTNADSFEDRFGGHGLSAHEQRSIMAIKTRKQAIEICAKVIADAAAQMDPHQ